MDTTVPGDSETHPIRSLDPRLLRVVQVLLVVYGAALVVISATMFGYYGFGDLATSCNSADEIAVDGDHRLFCSIWKSPNPQIQMYANDGTFLRSIPVDSLQGGFALRVGAEGNLNVLVFRTHRALELTPDGTLRPSRVAITVDEELKSYPTRVVRDGEIEYALAGDEVHARTGTVSSVFVPSRTPWFVSRYWFIPVLMAIGGTGALVATRAEEFTNL
ncbi:MAG: hypothetical protein ABI629_26725 [bacterium]